LVSPKSLWSAIHSIDRETVTSGTRKNMEIIFNDLRPLEKFITQEFDQAGV
jgi:hypothetical protein